MDRLNYHHLLYFWTVAREGSIARASVSLRLSQPAISGQIRALEEAIGEKLFERAGRGLRLTEVGQLVFEHAQGIFTIGRELTDSLKGRVTGRPLRVGLTDVVPKLIAYRLIAPAVRKGEPVRLVVREDAPERLFNELARHRLDAVITDAPPSPGEPYRFFSHVLGECGIVLLAAAARARRLRAGFPKSLDGEAFLMPSENTSLRRTLDGWFARHRIAPRIAGEFDDSALIKIFGEDGLGVFAVPQAIERDVVRQYRVRPIGVLQGASERFVAVTTERRFAHPALDAIHRGAKRDLFG